MASKVKEIYQYDGTQWGQAVPIGADASNVDVRTSDNTDIPLQNVLGSFNATEPSIKTQITGKVDKEGGDVAHAIINDPVNEIPIYDLDTEETSEKLISEDISTDTDMVVMSGDGENLTTMWGKFNRFRKRVDNKFKNYLVTSLEGVAPGASSDTKGYSTQALNNYFSDVIGYTSAASVSQVGSVASQLSSLNSNMNTVRTQTMLSGVWYNLTLEYANTNIMSAAGGGATFMPIDVQKTNRGFVGIYFGVKTTQARTNLPVARMSYTDQGQKYYITLSMPYVVFGTQDNTKGPWSINTFAAENYYIIYRPTWTANNVVIFYGFGLGIRHKV